MDEQERPKGLRAKLCAMMGEIGYIEKRGQNTAQNYSYVQASDIAGAVAKLCAKYGVIFYPTEEHLEWDTRQTSRGNAMFVCRASMKYVFGDADSEESITIPSTGEGMDTGDKAVYKAKTGALKYALIQSLLIATGDDPETETEAHEIKSTVEDAPKVAEGKPKYGPCPQCGNLGAIIKGRPEYGGGFVCYKKMGGCGAQFSDDDPRFNPDIRPRDNGPDIPVPSRETITEEQLHQLEEWIEEFGVNPENVIKQYRMSDKAIKKLSDFTQAQFDHAAKVFEHKRQRASKMN